MRKLFVLAGVLALGLFSSNARAQSNLAFGFSGFDTNNNLTINSTVFTNTDSGWIDALQADYPGNQNYVSGNLNGDNYSDFFDFDLTGLTGTVTSASFNVDTYVITVPGTFDIFATALTPAQVSSANAPLPYYADLTSGEEIGTIDFATSDSNSLATITLNTAGDEWLQANEGNGVVIGGQFNGASATPEPSSLVLLGTGIAGLAGMIRRKAAKGL
jgi:hypothetical protein